MFKKRYLWGVVCLLAIFSVAMSGCGGGGGSSSPAPMDDPQPMAVTIPAGLTATAGMQEIAAGESWTSGDVTFSCPAGGDACKVVVAADGTATSEGGMATAAESAAARTARLAREKAMTDAAIAQAKSKQDAIAAEAAQTTDLGLGGDGAAPTAGQVEGEYNLNIKHGETSIVVEGAAAADNVTFTQAMDFGHGRTMHTRTMDADDDGNVVKETVIVSTDIEAPKATAFAMVTGQALNADESGDAATGDDATALDFDITDADVLKLVMSSDFASGVAAVLTFIDDDPNTDADEAAEVDGTYNGAMGTYRCSGTGDCTVSIDAMGMITAMTGGWIFTPDEGATSDVPDGDYLHYGFWLEQITDEDGVVTYGEVQTFASSSVAASGATTAVTGSATYEGDAVGVYEHRVSAPDGTTASATSGHFTADVMLTATFGQVPVSETDTTGTIAPNLLNTLSGTINNFDLSGHDDGPGWSLVLQGDITEAAGTASGTVGTAKDRDDGSFTATFHGDVTAGTDGAIPKPGSVVGEFDALFSNGSVAGAFGARKD